MAMEQEATIVEEAMAEQTVDTGAEYTTEEGTPAEPTGNGQDEPIPTPSPTPVLPPQTTRLLNSRLLLN